MENKSIVLACRLDSENAIKLTKAIFEFLTKKGENVLFETRIAPKIQQYSGIDLNKLDNSICKLIISIGGDGTLLRVSSSLPPNDPPLILGVNIGSVGFLDESTERTIFNDLEMFLKGEYLIEKCSKITPYLVNNDNEEIKLNNAVNEVLIISSKASKVLQISVKINGVFLNRSYLDGVIISTAIGSTAYNLSAGGSIVVPTMNIMELTPLNSYARSGLKPIIVPCDQTEIEIRLLRPRLNAKIVIDGQTTIKKIAPNTRIRIRKSSSEIKFVRFSKNIYENYFQRLRKKIIGVLKVPIDDSPEE